MAETKEKKSASKSTASKKTSAKSTAAKAADTAAAVQEVEPAQVETITPKEVDVHQYITVRNGFQGRLIYKSKRTGEVFKWDEFGSEQDMELQELKNAKSSSKGFFINNWFMFDEPWVIDYLGVGRYYENAISIDDFDEIFTKTPAEIEDVVSRLSKGQKRSVAYRARQLIAEGEIDSIKAINALEKALETELIEK